ncbi:Exo endo phos 2 domain containing protein, partial [Asbolus verrucosus]
MDYKEQSVCSESSCEYESDSESDRENGDEKEKTGNRKKKKENTKQEFSIKYTKSNIVITTSCMEDFNKIKTTLSERKFLYHTYSTKTEKTHGFVLKGLGKEAKIEEIKTEIEEKGVKVVSINQMTNTIRPIFVVITNYEETIKTITKKRHLASSIECIAYKSRKEYLEKRKQEREDKKQKNRYIPAPQPQHNPWVKKQEETRKRQETSPEQQQPQRQQQQQQKPAESNNVENISGITELVSEVNKLCYNVVRNDRDGINPAGSTAILIKKGLPFREIRNLPGTSFEKSAVKVGTDGIMVIAMYNKPTNNISERDLKTIFKLDRKIILLGDTKGKHTSWNCNRTNPSGTVIKNFLDKYDVNLHFPEKPTHYPGNNTSPTIIDFMLTQNIGNIERPVSIPKLNSDHNPVITHINNIHVDNIRKTIITYKNTNWKEFRKTLDTKIAINDNINTIETLETETQKLTQAIQHATKKHTEQITININKDKLPPHITNLIKDKNKTRK